MNVPFSYSVEIFSSKLSFLNSGQAIIRLNINEKYFDHNVDDAHVDASAADWLCSLDDTLSQIYVNEYLANSFARYYPDNRRKGEVSCLVT